MNNCTISGTVRNIPQLRYVDETPICEVLVDIPVRPDAPSCLKILVWGKLASEVHKIAQGSQIIVEGDLRTRTVEMEQFKEKRVELTARRVCLVKDLQLVKTPEDPSSEPVVKPTTSPDRKAEKVSNSSKTPKGAAESFEDEIPF
jgi:single-stranded DNA-binding protein